MMMDTFVTFLLDLVRAVVLTYVITRTATKTATSAIAAYLQVGIITNKEPLQDGQKEEKKRRS